MIILLFAEILIIAMFSIPAIRLIKNYKKISKWHYFYPFLGLIVWLVMAMFNIGRIITLSNFVVETFWITVVSAANPWVIFLLHKKGSKVGNLIANFLTILPIIFAIIMRLLIATLPE